MEEIELLDLKKDYNKDTIKKVVDNEKPKDNNIIIINNKINDEINNINNVKEIKEIGEEKKNIKKQRSSFSLEGAKKPLSIYTRRVMNVSKIKKYLNENSSKGVVGGRNLGNTCFMNSSIACISNCTELTYYFLCGDYKKDLNYENKNGMKGKLAKSWGNLLKEYWVENTDEGDPKEFKDTIGEKATMFRGFRQHDSNEFMNIFLDYLNEDLNYTSEKKYIELEEKKDNETDEQCSKRFWESNLKRNDSIITDLFCGQFRSTLTCPKCNRISITFEPFYSINLPIIKKEKNQKKIIKKQNEAKNIEEYKIYYVPKYGLRIPYSVKFQNIPNTTTFSKCFDILKNEESFKYHGKLDKVNYMKIDMKKYKEEINGESCIDEQSQIFMYEIIDEEKNDIKIPINFVYKMDGNEELGNSHFPRFVTGSKDMTLEELNKFVYFLVRKYISSPFVKEGEEIDEVSEQIKKYEKDMYMDDERLYDLIGNEYQRIFGENPSEEDKVQLKEFFDDIPFKFKLKELIEEKHIDILSSDNLNKISDEFKKLTKASSLQDKVIDCLDKIPECIFYVEFCIKSKYINENNFKLDRSFVKRIEFPIEEQKNDEKEKEEKKEEENNEDNNNPNLVDCLKYFCQEEQLKKGNEWYCSKCKEHLLASKKMEIYYLPKLLIICFKRFIKDSYRWEKNEEYINFPISNFNMKDLIIGPDKDHSVYDLFAVSQHYGSTGFGHYTAVCKNENDWYNYDDSYVSKTSANSCLSSAAYVLFYRRQTD